MNGNGVWEIALLGGKLGLLRRVLFSALFWGCWAVYVAVDWRVLGVIKYWVVVLMCFPLFCRG